MLPSWCDETVTVLRAPVVTRGGRQARDWRAAAPHELRGCSLQPAGTETAQEGSQRNASASTATLLCPWGADVREHDRVVASGRTWEVEGVPMGVRSPTGRASNIRVTLSEWRG